MLIFYGEDYSFRSNKFTYHLLDCIEYVFYKSRTCVVLNESKNTKYQFSYKLSKIPNNKWEYKLKNSSRMKWVRLTEIAVS